MKSAVAVAACLMAATATAGPLLDPDSRAALGAEIRALLLDEPEILRRALDGPGMYDDDMAADRATLAGLHAELFAHGLPGFGADSAAVAIALLTGPGCAACTRAQDDLRALAETLPIRVYLVDTATAPHLLDVLGLDLLPAYVVGGTIIRGHVPPLAIERAVSRALR